jgi:dipeptidyl aminopeptidase/acylaminoacyl peptidase
MKAGGFVGLLAAVVLGGGAGAAPPLEAFGALQTIADAALSPDGRRIAFLYNIADGTRLFLVRDLETGESNGLNASDLKARGVGWANNRFALLWASETTDSRFFRESTYEFGAVFAYDTQENKYEQLLAHGSNLSVNESLAAIDAVVAGENEVLMPAFADDDGARPRALWRVDLRSGRGRVVERGEPDTRQFLVSSDGEAYARIDYFTNSNSFRVRSHTGRNWRTIYEEESETFPFSFLGFLNGTTEAAFVSYADRDTQGLYAMGLEDGSVSGPLLAREDADVVAVISTFAGNVVLGAGFANITGVEYEFLDPELDAAWRRVTEDFPNHAVSPRDLSEDRSKWLVYVEGPATPGWYALYDIVQDQSQIIGEARPEIDRDSIAPVFAIEYQARDGRTISALLTIPPGREPEALPTVVMPHGGPASFDSYGWDWLAQFFANQGYAVLQPNYRGSAGFGAAFEDAGNGEWGRAVQHDVSDGVEAMIASGYSDPDRICIVGWSYGGYLALAGAAFTPELYACAASIAGVSDVSRMLADERRTYGARSSTVAYWSNLMRGEEGEVRTNDISPARFAENVVAPVLLIHGRDDTVVSFEQSQIMERALDRAGKDVELVALRGEDHGLSLGETRIEALRALDGFLRAHLGGESR